MVKLRQFTRPLPKEAAHSELTAAAAVVDMSKEADRRYLKAVTSASKHSGIKPWQWYERLGEVAYSVNRSARVAGYADFKVQRLNDDGKTWDEVSSGPLSELPKTFSSPFNGPRGLIERFYALMKVPADSLLIRVREEGEVVGFHFLGADEIDQSELDPTLTRAANREGIRWVMLPTTLGAEERLVRDVEARDVLGRVWHPDFRWIERPRSTLYALDTECEALDALTRSILGRLKSRFALNGMWYLPSELSEAKVATSRTSSGQSDLLQYISAAMLDGVSNWDKNTAHVPILLRGPGDAGKNIQEFLPNRAIETTDIQLRTELIERILFGMDIQQTAVTGGEEVSHWGSWNASDEERRIAVEPDLEMLDWALTTLILHPQMIEDGASSEEILRHRVWHDLDRASVRTNAQEDTRQAHDRGVANAVALARRTGLVDDEILEGDEYVRWVGSKTNEPYLMMFGLPEASKIDWTKVSATAKPGPAESNPGDKPKTGPGVGDPGSPNGAKRSTPKRATPA